MTMTFEKLAARGAQGVAAGSIVAWLGLVWMTRPVSSGGIDATLHLAVAASSFVVFGFVAAVHAWMGAQLKHGPDSIRG